MLHINNLTYRIEGRPIFENATAGIPTGHKVGLVGRNGAGKTTLLKLITGELGAEDGSIFTPKTSSIGYVAQEAPGGTISLIDWVLDADTERAALLAEAETATEPDRIAEIQIRLADIDAHTAPSRAARILAGLGFDEQAQARACSEYSGGWRMRVALAAVLFLEPEILLLDEPTNYLDLEGTMWLENYLSTYPHTMLMVSHDRELLNRAVSHILHLDQGRLSLYTGGYDAFEESVREKQRLNLKLKKKQDEERRHIESFIDRFRAQANKAKQAQSRIKALARMKPIAAQLEQRVVPFQLPNPKKALASPLIQLEEVSAGYEPGRAILSDLNLRLDADDRIGLLGANGNGKSTFAKLIAGRLKPQSGKRRGSDKIVVGFFAQHQMDDLPDAMTPYDHMLKLMPDATEAQRRSKLGSIGFSFEKSDTRAEHLSGGEKARLLLALAAFHSPHLLILDEPTNHLDVDSREALVRAIADYEGAVILISHDRHLLEASCDRLWLVDQGRVEPYDGDMDSYREMLLSQRSDQRNSKKGRKGKQQEEQGRASAMAPVDKVEQRRAAAARRAQIAPLRKEVTLHEKRLAKLQEQIDDIDNKLADTSLYERFPDAARTLGAERGKLAKLLQQCEDAWLTASEAVERAQNEKLQDTK